MLIRSALLSDAPALAAIYAPYVERTAITFEYEPPSVQAFEKRMEAIMARYPYLVLEDDEGTALGYAYAGAFKTRAAYDWAVETSVYLRMDARGKGYGKALYAALEEALIRRGFLNAYACVTCPEKDDEYVTRASVRFHERMGYRLCGTFRRCGYKFGRWYDMVWMEKWLGDHKNNPPSPFGAKKAR